MDNDLSDVLNKFSEILKEKDIDLSSISAGETSSPASNTDLGLDIDTIMKIKNIITKINKNQNSPRNMLLNSLKPFLEDKKQEKLNNYIQIANLLSVLEDMDLGINLLDNQKGYDLVLIITLFLLII